jgi:hypothetical protein
LSISFAMIAYYVLHEARADRQQEHAVTAFDRRRRVAQRDTRPANAPKTNPSNERRCRQFEFPAS